MDAAARFLISGTVQGVCFRASTHAQAQRLNLFGYAKNLPDGRVEVLAIGAPAAIESLAAWLSLGPEWAQVVGVERETVDAVPHMTGFAIG